MVSLLHCELLKGLRIRSGPIGREDPSELSEEPPAVVGTLPGN
jgi:hypothetical protein